jgi:anti-repressor protein
MDELKAFEYEGHGVRTVQKDGETWWVLKDVCEVFGETNYRRSIQSLDEDEKGVSQMYTPGGLQNVAIINESGLYSLLFAMQPTKARGASEEYIAEREAKLRNFRRWVTHEVLPTTRKSLDGEQTDKEREGGKMAMNELRAFEYNGKEVRTAQKDGETWWVLKDVCAVLELANVGNIAARLDDDEKSNIHQTDIRNENIDIPNRGLTVINESGLYNVILRSDKPEAKAFKRWVMHEVLPSIRKTGGYVGDEGLFVDTYLPFADENVRALFGLTLSTIRQLNGQIEILRPKAAFADAVSVSDSTILVGEIAKILNGNGIEIGPNRLFEKLRQDGYLIKRKGTDRNMPTQKAMRLGLFKVNESVVSSPDGRATLVRTPRATGKGQVYLVNKFLKEQAEQSNGTDHGTKRQEKPPASRNAQ